MSEGGQNENNKFTVIRICQFSKEKFTKREHYILENLDLENFMIKKYGIPKPKLVISIKGTNSKDERFQKSLEKYIISIMDYQIFKNDQIKTSKEELEKKKNLKIEVENNQKKMASPLKETQQLALKQSLINVLKMENTWIILDDAFVELSELIENDCSNLSVQHSFAVISIITSVDKDLKEKMTQKKDTKNKDISQSKDTKESEKEKKDKKKTNIIHITLDIEYEECTVEAKFLETVNEVINENYEIKKYDEEISKSINESLRNETVHKILGLWNEENYKTQNHRIFELIKTFNKVIKIKNQFKNDEKSKSPENPSENETTVKIVKKILDLWNDGKYTSQNEKILQLIETFEQTDISEKQIRVEAKVKDSVNYFQDTLTIDIVDKILGLWNEKKMDNQRILEVVKTFDQIDKIKRIFNAGTMDIVINDYLEHFIEQNQWEYLYIFLKYEKSFKRIVNDFRNSKTEQKNLYQLYFNEESEIFLYANLNLDDDRMAYVDLKLNLYSGGLFKYLLNEPPKNNVCDNCCLKSVRVAGSKDDDALSKESQNLKEMKKFKFAQNHFLCSLMSSKIEMSEIFWKLGKDHMGAALIGSIICTAMEARAKSQGKMDKMSEYNKQKEAYENIARLILKEAYRIDEIRAHLLLMRTLPKWGGFSCYQIAAKNDKIEFLSEVAVETKLNSIWLGEIPPTTSIFKIFFNIPFGLLYLAIAIIAFMSRLLIFANRISTKKKNETKQRKFSKKQQTETYQSEVPDKQSSTRFNKYNYLKKRHEQRMGKIKFLEAVKCTYNAPVTKFIMNIVSYLAFLICFTYFIVIELKVINENLKDSQRIMEYIVYTFFLSFIVDELRQLIMSDKINNFKRRLLKWISSYWNIFDIITYFLFGISFVLRIVIRIENDFVYCRIMFAITLSCFYLRFMEFYYINESIGPKIIMISKMVKDIAFFLAIYLIALFAFGSLSLALLKPNSNLNDYGLRDLVYYPYWELFGQMNLTYLEGDVVNSSIKGPNAIVVAANALFLLFVNILLINLLIAMFGLTFNKVQAKSNKIWDSIRYQIIEEFYYRPILPPPLNIFETFYLCIRSIVKKDEDDDLVIKLTDEEDEECSNFERMCMEKCLSSSALNLVKFDIEISKKAENNITDESKDFKK